MTDETKAQREADAVRAERYRRDLAVRCPVKNCKAKRGEPCVNVPPGLVHQSRRVLTMAVQGERIPTEVLREQRERAAIDKKLRGE